MHSNISHSINHQPNNEQTKINDILSFMNYRVKIYLKNKKKTDNTSMSKFKTLFYFYRKPAYGTLV